MKTFAIFPTICVFVLLLALLKRMQQGNTIAIRWSIAGAIIFGFLMTWFSVEAFEVLISMNFIGSLICIPALTYLAYQQFRNKSEERINWLKLFLVGLVATVLTVLVAACLIFIALVNNPMDPPMIKNQEESR